MGLHDQTVDLIIDYRVGCITFDQFRALMLRRQQHLKANLDSSTFLHLVAAID